MSADNKAVEKRVLALAERLGRLMGTVERRTEGWLEQKALKNQVAQIRDEAAELMNHLGQAISSGRSTANPANKGTPAQAKAKGQAPAPAAATGRSGGAVDAPGKARRKTPPSTPGANRAKHSGQMVSKVVAAKTQRLPQRRPQRRG